MKITPLLLLMLLVIPTTLAIDLEYSADNATWYNVTNIQENNSIAVQDFLAEDTLYYFRARNQTSDLWVYVNATTTTGGEVALNDLAIAVVILGFSMVLIVIGLYLIERRKNDGY